MKQLIILFLLSSSFHTLSYAQSNPLASKSEASSSNDGKSGGVYKGVMINPSGTIKITVQGSTASAEINIEGVTKTLRATNLPSGWVSGQVLKNITFASDKWSLIFSVGNKGTKPEVELSIPENKDVKVHVVKENSSALVKAYEGSYGDGKSSSDKGTLNFMIYPSDSIFGIYQHPSGSKHLMYGQIDSVNNQIEFFGLAEYMKAVAPLTTDQFSGTWKKEDLSGKSQTYPNGLWKAKRTL